MTAMPGAFVALCVCLMCLHYVCVSCMHSLCGNRSDSDIGRVRGWKPCRPCLQVIPLCMPYTCALYVCLTCVPCVHAFLIRMACPRCHTLFLICMACTRWHTYLDAVLCALCVCRILRIYGIWRIYHIWRIYGVCSAWPSMCA